MAHMKYLVLRLEETTYEKVVMFEDSFEHKAFAQMCPPGWKAVRGGFVNIWANNDKLIISCCGESFSLGISSDKNKDQDLIRKRLEA